MLQLNHSEFIWGKFYQSLFDKFVNTVQAHSCIDQKNSVYIAHEVLLEEFDSLQQFSYLITFNW